MTQHAHTLEQRPGLMRRGVADEGSRWIGTRPTRGLTSAAQSSRSQPTPHAGSGLTACGGGHRGPHHTSSHESEIWCWFDAGSGCRALSRCLLELPDTDLDNRWFQNLAALPPLQPAASPGLGNCLGSIDAVGLRDR
ncbi:hypothetical protein HMPREF9153_1467 [Cutibacterium avidum ATCC 25577]|uniref:Uncharacterized protein n=1 Tax=Cutibacterium avidum ATCC 25577 TaxID=997355 RepID=G4CY60_9ACTN|nr:hypothetical protein HMPREF9153_1467 [Cutibacterium avidum ATCC 25577]